MRVETVNDKTISLSGPKGIEKIAVIPAETGSLAFLTPEATLLPGATYTVSINGAIDRDGLSLPVSGISFTTKSVVGSAPTTPTPTPGGGLNPVTPLPAPVPTVVGDDDLIWQGKLKDGRPRSDWEDLPALQAPAGVTALAGQVLDLKGNPLAGVNSKLKANM